MQEMQEMRVQSLGQENLLEEETAACSWKNPIDRGAWWATVHGVSKSQIRLSKHACTHTHKPIIFYLDWDS